MPKTSHCEDTDASEPGTTTSTVASSVLMIWFSTFSAKGGAQEARGASMWHFQLLECEVFLDPGKSQEGDGV